MIDVPRATYDRIGLLYAKHRRPDPRIAAAICRALGPARSVVNVGAGTGSYEPLDCRVVAVEPSIVMIRQRPRSAAPVVRASADALPFARPVFDAALAALTVHHWRDWKHGLREMRRVARRIVVLTFDVRLQQDFWLVRDYVPAMRMELNRIPGVDAVADELGATRVETVVVPHDCLDGFFCAYWRRPDAYLDAEVRACISGLTQLAPNDMMPGLARLRSDLATGRWHERNRKLIGLNELDCGYRLVVCE